VIVVDTLVWVVFKISPAASTTTVSATPPGVRVGLMLVGTPALRRMSSREAVANPFMATVTLYSPGSSAGIVNRPSAPEIAVEVDAVALFLAVMVAPGTTAPEESKTVPESVAVTPPCANARRGDIASAISKSTAASGSTRNLITPPVDFFSKSGPEAKGGFEG